jgi:hypothetical protein
MMTLIERILTDPSVRDKQVNAYSAIVIGLPIIPWLGSSQE